MKHLINPRRILAMLSEQTGIPAPCIRVLLLIYHERTPMMPMQIKAATEHKKMDDILRWMRKRNMISYRNPVVIHEEGLNAIATLTAAYKNVSRVLKLD